MLAGRGHAVLLVTHQLQFMKDVQTIVVLAHGSIAGKGDFMVR